MTDEERRNTPPSETENVPRDEQLVRLSLGGEKEADEQGRFSVREADKKVRDGLVSLMRDAGIEISMDGKEGQRVLDEEKGWVAMGKKNQPVIPSYRETNLLSKQLSYQVLTVQI